MKLMREVFDYCQTKAKARVRPTPKERRATLSALPQDSASQIKIESNALRAATGQRRTIQIARDPRKSAKRNQKRESNALHAGPKTRGVTLPVRAMQTNESDPL